MGVPKTIDNDLAVTDHTPGFGSAAKYIAATVKEIIRDGETTLIDTDEIKSLRHPEGVIRLARRSADGEAVACYAMAYGGGNRTAQFEVEGFEIVSYYGNAACGLQNGRFCVELGEKPLSACVAVLRKKRA